MTATMTPVFVDTNVFVYARDESQPEKQARSISWLRSIATHRRGRVSQQVLNEYYSVVTRKLKPPMPPELARRHVRSLLFWSPVPIDSSLMLQAWKVQDRFKLSWWDALIMAAAQATEARFLLTEDLQAGQEFGGLRVISPFVTAPGDLD
ncbi:PIN domain-containing protein [Myxococcota bacterium]|nr:PIN domain-containing protein [Myxococcota bacterium]